MKNNFKPTYLYIKKCGHCDLKYFGMTTGEDPIKYKGSGSVWKAHLRKHRCRDQVVTLFCKLFTDKNKCIRFSKLFSRIANIVKSNSWANLIVEDGINNGISSPNITDEMRKKMSQSHTGTKHSLERCNNISAALIGKPKSEEHRNRNSVAQKNRKDSPGRGKKISEANKGKIVSKETGDKISAALRGKQKPVTECPYCKKIGASGIMKRWHFENCKFKTSKM